MPVSIIVAMGLNCVIGDDGGLPWHLPRDLRRFRELTWGKPVVMGRRTLELIGKPLPGRQNVVLSRNRGYTAPGCHVVADVRAALAVGHRLLAEEHGHAKESGEAGAGEIMIIGGGEVYRQFVALADRVYLTVVQGNFRGTTTFPFAEISSTPWELLTREDVPAGKDAAFAHTFLALGRQRETGRTSRCLVNLPALLQVV